VLLALLLLTCYVSVARRRRRRRKQQQQKQRTLLSMHLLFELLLLQQLAIDLLKICNLVHESDEKELKNSFKIRQTNLLGQKLDFSFLRQQSRS
jgi:hypothetical protein